MTQIVSGQINTGTNTPTGAKMKVAVDNQYVCKDEFLASYEAKGLGLTVNDPEYSNGALDRMLLQASAYVNRYTRRWFDTQTIDETKTGFQVRPYNPQLVTVVLQNSPYSQINSMYIQVLQWFIQIIVSGPGSYLQDFYDKGFCKIVPLLSTAGTGLGTPIPAAILDRVPLGILWTNYTFGYGTVLIQEPLTNISQTKQWQAPLGNRLWAPDQTLTVYDGATVLVKGTDYTVDYPNGMVTMTGHTVTGAVTATFTTNDSTPFDIKEATMLVATHLIGQALANPTGAASMSIQTYSSSWSQGDTKVEERFKSLLQAYVRVTPIILGF